MTETDNELLTAAISEGAALAPDSHDVLRAVRVRVARQQRFRRSGIAVAGAVASVIAVFGAVTVVQKWPGGSLDTAAHGPGGVMPVPAQQCTLTFGWLPPGLKSPVRSCGPDGENVGYPMDGGNYLSVGMLNASWQPTLDAAGLQQIEVGGRPAAICSKPTRTAITFQLPSGHWVQLEYGNGLPGSSSSGAQQTTLRNDALAIANGMSEGTADDVQVAFAPGYLPADMSLAGVGTGTTPGTGQLHYGDGSGAVTKVEVGGGTDGLTDIMPVSDDRHTLSISLLSPDPGLMSHSANPVGRLGNLTIYSINQGTAVLVPGFHGATLEVATSAVRYVNSTEPPGGALSTDELIKIAQHIQWFG
ncbi:hypothetical protein [Rugosimonospora africana]|uniref:Uncharacterized protein n=1 Tax=Rugosimonospora africana TaxID=556532 RepID=A0A8J3QYY8_9ACTN|nr:hypothetical protein [Rugosimonospora africana]GIH17211.1 hypothetical protein Raf01_53830 [Rugosimonospora africana]